MKAESANGFVGVSSDEWDGWPRIAQLMSEHRHVEVGVGPQEHHPNFREAAEPYATEMVYHGEEENRRGSFGTPVSIDPY
jgi:hypothetical protein